MAKPFMLTLIRHAKTKSNVERRYLGWTDEGILQQCLPLIDQELPLVYGSDLKRCQQTAAAYFPHATYRAITDFRESNFGDFEGCTYEDLQFRPQYRNWIDAPMYRAPPNGETLVQLIARVRRGLRNITESSHATILLHGGSLRAVLIQFSPQLSDFWQWQIGHDEQYKLRWSSFQAFKEGQRCISLSVEPLMVKDDI